MPTHLRKRDGSDVVLEGYFVSITRREFSIATASTVTLTILGCDGQAQPAKVKLDRSAKEKSDPKKANLATEPFLVGPPSGYDKPGVYDELKAEKGIWIVSDGKELVVLSATCTHLACSTDLDRTKQRFKCPCHESEFDFEGINGEGSKASRPLERCALRLVDSGEGAGQIEIDPTQRFRQDKDQWSDPASTFKLG